MAVFRKEHLDVHIKELETYYWAVRRAAEGSLPNADTAHLHHCDPEQFRTEFTEVDLDWLEYQVGHFKEAVAFVKRLKNKAVKKVHRA